VDPAFLPPPAAVWNALVDLIGDGALFSNLLVTLADSLFGLLVAILIGVPFGAAMALSRGFDQFATPLVRLTYSLPKSSLIPLFILWFGIGAGPSVLAVILASLLPIIVYTHRGVRSTPQVLVWSALALGTPRRAVAIRIMLPAAQRSIATGVRIALGFSFLLSISAEMIAARAGIGKLMFMYGENGIYAYMFAALAAVIMVAFFADTLLVALYLHWLRWDESAASGVV
jgi:NitT/TauT family transport system permease protein